MGRSITDWAGNILAFAVVIIVNSLASAVPLGGQTTGQISANYPSLFTPEGFTFAIWGLIYLSLGVYVVWQALPGQRDNADLAAIDMPFKLNCLFNSAWIFAWHYDFLLLSMLLMVAILATLIPIFRRVHSRGSWIVRLPFSVYTGWITVATIANFSALQTGWDFNDAGLTAVQWTWLKLAVAGTIGAVVVSRTRNIPYVLVIAWAAFGIYAKQGATPEVAGAAITLSVLAVLLALSTLLPRRLTAPV